MNEAIRKVADAFVSDYIVCRLGEGASVPQIKAEIEGFYSEWVLDVA